MYLSTFLSTFLSTLIISSGTVFTAALHAQALVISKKNIEMEKVVNYKLFKRCVWKKNLICEQKYKCTRRTFAYKISLDNENNLHK